MKNLVEKLEINKNTKLAKKNILISEINSEETKDFSYQTFSYKDAEKCYERGYVIANTDKDQLSIIAFNDNKENTDIDTLFWDYGFDIEEILNLYVGTMTSGPHGIRIIRLW